MSETDDRTIQIVISKKNSPFLASNMDPYLAQPQEQSPLYYKIPYDIPIYRPLIRITTLTIEENFGVEVAFNLPEIRIRIFRYALKPSHNPDKAYEEGSFYYRPSHTSGYLISISLLLACRRIYLEIALLPCSLNTLSYWWGRPPPGKPECQLPNPDIQNLSPIQRQVIAVQVFIEQFHLEKTFREVLRNPRFCPAHLTLTLRHTDWWHWDKNEPLALDPKKSGRPLPHTTRGPGEGFDAKSWGHALRHMTSLKTFTLELETVMNKKKELDLIIANLSQITFPMICAESTQFSSGLELVYDCTATRTSTWKGIDRFYEIQSRQTMEMYARLGMTQGLGRFIPRLRRRERVYIDQGVVQGELGTMNENGGIGAREMTANEPPRLEYYVVEVGWKMVRNNAHHLSHPRDIAQFMAGLAQPSEDCSKTGLADNTG